MSDSMKLEKPVWEGMGILICTKCGARSDQPEFAEQLKMKMKSELRNLNLNKKFRVMTSSCLGTCPESLQAVALVPTDKNETQIMVCDFADVEPNLKKIFQLG